MTQRGKQEKYLKNLDELEEDDNVAGLTKEEKVLMNILKAS